MSILISGDFVNNTIPLWEPSNSSSIPPVIVAANAGLEVSMTATGNFYNLTAPSSVRRDAGWYQVTASVNFDPKSATDTKTFSVRLRDANAASANLGTYCVGPTGAAGPSYPTTTGSTNGYGKWLTVSWVYYVGTSDYTNPIQFELASSTSSIAGGAPAARGQLSVTFIAA